MPQLQALLPFLVLDPIADAILRLGGFDELEPVLAGGLVCRGRNLDNIAVFQFGLQGNQAAVDLGAGATLADRRFSDLPELLRDGDLLVFNDTRVIPARLHGHKASGGRVEVLVERLLDTHHVLAHVRASKTPRPGNPLRLEGCIDAEVLGREGELFKLRFDDPREVVLVGLANACGLFDEILSPDERARRRPRIIAIRKLDLLGQAMTKKDIVAEDQTYRVSADKRLADNKGLGQSLRPGLDLILQGDTPSGTVTQQLYELSLIFRCSYHQNFPDLIRLVETTYRHIQTVLYRIHAGLHKIRR